MALVTKPNPLPSELNYVPTGGKLHRVASDESWWTLADLPEVRAAKMSANDLCYFNFRTRIPREINWYLYHKVGCRHVTTDGENYMFTSADDPGVVYLPQIGTRPPVNEIPPEEEKPKLEMWVGLGGKAGTMFAVAGIETMEGLVVSLDKPHRWMALQASINRLGGGWGVTGGVCLLVLTGVTQPSQLNGFQTGGVDFNAALGENWGKIVKGTGVARKLAPVIEVIRNIGARTPSGLKTLLKTDPDRYQDLVKAMLQVHDSLGSKAGETNVYMVDIPWLGGGIEVSVFFGVANYTALWDSA